ncbi:hypothetical protein [Nereida sp. MMG025]|uniref:hypothetical protein n=1 Tax=Nereida sp. MMG025 TaxID=2909981 RepID=UPI001F2E9870|nr:hypothetical protein [Nereida sp. MMG025]MCF6444235.1 hypothetical protein [Nereida sp. MMG025]
MRVLLLILSFLATQVHADDRLVRVYAAPELVQSGVMQHLAPRFSLKTQVRIEFVAQPTAAELVLDRDGHALFDGFGTTWGVSVSTETDAALRLKTWLQSGVGTDTVLSFAPDGQALFAEPTLQTVVAKVREMDSTAILGQEISHVKCARCHVTQAGRGQIDIGSTPSFAVLRSLSDWESRFSAFYVLKPHPAFTQIDGVTPPFANDRPSPIAPITLSLEDLDAIMAYVDAMDAADLGQPLQHQ